MQNLGKVLVIANPAARNGEGKRAAEYVRSASATLSSEAFDFRMTESPGQATRDAAGARGYDTVLVLGGDGVIHEAVGGLMQLPREERPTLGVIPCGNGNDYARTLGMGLDWRDALSRLVFAEARQVDVGLCNGEPFVQTLSFGLDAAIALGTHERRRRTGTHGTLLFVEEGVSQLARNRTAYDYVCSFDGGASQEGSMLLFAVQVGPTYGGGFRICPDADPADGRFDVCIARIKSGLDDEPDEDDAEMRRLVLKWERDFVQHAIDAEEVSPMTGYRMLNRLAETEALMNHNRDIKWFLGVARRRISMEVHSIKRFLVDKVPMMSASDEEREMRELQAKSLESVMSKLRELLNDPAYRTEDVSALMVEVQRDLRRCKRIGRDIGTVARVEDRATEVRRLGYALELEHIQRMYESRRISRAMAKYMRENVALMQLDLEDKV